jgi:hypothetical protein
MASQEIGATRAPREPPQPVHRDRHNDIDVPSLESIAVPPYQQRREPSSLELAPWPLGRKHCRANRVVVASQDGDAIKSRATLTTRTNDLGVVVTGGAGLATAATPRIAPFEQAAAGGTNDR